MPAKPLWLLQLPRIIRAVEVFPAPVVDRAAIEQLFGVRRRRAIELLGLFGGYQVGRTFVIGRDDLIGQLRAAAASDVFYFEKRRREKLGDALENVRKLRQASQVRIRPPYSGAFAALPSGVSLEPGRLIVTFTGAEDLLGKLYGIAQTAATDFGAFEAATRMA